MENQNITTHKTGFLDLPPELRLIIYNLATIGPTHNQLWLSGATHLNEPEIFHLAPFYQVSRQTREDMMGLFQHNRFGLTVDSMPPHFGRPSSVANAPPAKHLRSVLPNLQCVNMSVFVATLGESGLRDIVAEAQRIVEIFANSGELGSFAFTVSLHHGIGGQWFINRRRALRRSVSKGGREKGLSWMQIELEFARRAVEMLLDQDGYFAVTGTNP